MMMAICSSSHAAILSASRYWLHLLNLHKQSTVRSSSLFSAFVDDGMISSTRCVTLNSVRSLQMSVK